jgi:hypothetical protein
MQMELVRMLQEVTVLLDLLWESCGKDDSILWDMLDDMFHRMLKLCSHTIKLAAAPAATEPHQLDIIGTES